MSADRACTVRIDPAGYTLEIEPGEVFLDAIFAAGEEWPTTCFGQMECMLCSLEVKEGHEFVKDPTPEEVEAVNFRYAGEGDPSRLRLGCCLEFNGPGPVTIWKREFRR